MERKISIQLYMIALIIAAALFSIGVYVGTIINQDVMNSIGEEIVSINQRVSGIGLLFLLEENNTAFCPVYRSELQNLDREREKLGYKISIMEEERGFSSSEIKKSYMALQAQAYLFANKIKEKCGDKYTTVLFFYDNKNCTDCKKVGEAILAARDDLPNGSMVKIYAFDGGIESPIVEALETQYGVNAHPTTIINNKSYVGAASRETLLGAMKNAD